MSNLGQDRSTAVARSPWVRTARDAVPQTAIRIIIVIAVAAITIRLFNGLRIGPIEAVFLVGSLIAAAGFGLIAGLVTAAIAFVAYHALVGGALPPLDLGSRDTLLLVLFGCSVAIIGLYTDLVRQRTRRPPSLLEAGRPLSAHASGHAIGQFLDDAQQRRPAIEPPTLASEAQRAFTTLCVTGAGLTAALTLRDVLGSTAGVLIATGSVLVAGGLMGARWGVAAGFLVGVALSALQIAQVHAVLPGPWVEVVEALAIAGAGWGVGALSDRLQHERAALRTLVEASRDLSAGADEASIRQVLHDGLSQIAKGGLVQLLDESGVLFAGSNTDNKAWAASDQFGTDDRWRTRRLAADGREVGSVIWRFPGLKQDAQIADEIAISLIDLGASAIVRTRLSVERAEMEYVARAEHLRTILLDAVSHHFRSPLAGILGSVTSILSLPEPHDRSVRRELLLIIKEQANRLSRYVDNFLSLARLESGSIEINLSDFSIEPLIYDVWETFGEVGGARRYLHVKLDEDLVRSDASLLAQVFGNILENAIKYSSEESVVTVRGRREGARLVVEVADQGPGVPSASLNRMFERFYRSQAANAPGLGLGLYITRSLVEMLGGEVTARNRTDDGPGLVVSIALPLAEPSL